MICQRVPQLFYTTVKPTFITMSISGHKPDAHYLHVRVVILKSDSIVSVWQLQEFKIFHRFPLKVHLMFFNYFI